MKIERPSGAVLADQAALKAVENSAPFSKLPLGSSESVDIQFTFDHRVFDGGGIGRLRRF